MGIQIDKIKGALFHKHKVADISDPTNLVSDDAYAAGWDGVTTIGASKNAIYDKISTLAGGHDPVTLDVNAATILDLSTQELGLDNQTANTVFAGAVSGAAATPAFRALVSADVSADMINDTHIDWGTGANQVSAVDVPIADAGTYFDTDNVEAALQDLALPPTKTIHISPGFTDNAVTLKYSTIQAALTAHTAGGELFLVYPGTYTDDTITFTANDQTVRGMGISPSECKVTTASSNICDYGAFLRCRVSRIKMEVTAGTTLVHTAQGAAGSCNFVRCHLTMTTSYATNGVQPACLFNSGASTVKIVEGTIEYNHTGSNALVAKAPINWDTQDSTVELDTANIKITCANDAFVTGISFGTGATALKVNRCDATITDPGAAIIAGFYVGAATAAVGGGAAVGEFFYNTLHICGGGALAAGVFVNAVGADIRGIFNHIHVVDSTANYSYFLADVASTVASQFEDLIAADGISNVSGTVTMVKVNSETDGDFDVSGTITANAIAGDITGNAATVTTNANLTGPITSIGNATSIASQTGTGTKFVVDTSPVIVTPTIASFANAEHDHSAAGATGGTIADITGNAATVTNGVYTTDFPLNQDTTGKAATAGNADTVTNATFTTALTVDTGAVTLTGDAAGSVLTLGDGAISIDGSNTGDQTGIVGISGTKAEFDAACSDEDFAYSGGAFHDGFSDFVSNEHIDWTGASTNFYTTGTGRINGNTGIGGAPTCRLQVFASTVIPVIFGSSNASWAGFEQRATTSGAHPYIQWYNSADGDKAWVHLDPVNNYLRFSFTGGLDDILKITTSRNVKVTGSFTTTGAILAEDKIQFTQTDGNEYIDSLNSGYMDYGATTGHRFRTRVYLTEDTADTPSPTLYFDGGNTRRGTICQKEDAASLSAFVMDTNGSIELQTDGNARLTVEAGGDIVIGEELELDGDFNHDGSNVGFYGTTPIAQAVLATGAAATVDDVISALQALGLVKQA